MLKEIIYDKLTEAGNVIKPSGSKFILTTCLNPNHKDKHPSFSINLDTGYGVCFSCGYKVGKKYWLYGLEDEEAVDALVRSSLYKRIEDMYDDTPVRTRELFMPPVSDEKITTPWRSLTKETIEKYSLYYCDTGHFEDRIIFPMWDKEGTIIAFNSRALGECKEGLQKYKYSKGLDVNKIIYPPVEKNTKEIVICEGIMDALSMVQEGIPAIMNFGVNYTFSSEKIATLLKSGVETIYLAFDNDDAGRSAIIKYMQSELPDYFEVRHARLYDKLAPFYESGAKDFNEFLEKK
jgi:DNA primase